MMKKNYLFSVLFLVIGIFCLPYKGMTQLLFKEPFNYVAHATNSLSIQSGAVWKSSGSTGGDVLVSTGSLSYSGLTGIAGNKVSGIANGKTSYINFAEQTTGTVYASAIINVTDITSTSTAPAAGASAFMAFGLSNVSALTGLNIRKSLNDGTKFNLGIAKRHNSAVTWFSDELSVNTPYFIVIAHEFTDDVIATKDIEKLWVNPAFDATEPTPSVTTSVGNGMTNIAAFAIRQAVNAASIDIDEIRIGTSWASVTLSTLPVKLLSFNAQELSGKIRLNWKTASEKNNSHFEIHRSANGYDYENLGTVSGSGNQDKETSYSFIDDNPLSVTAYYKLKQFDFEGKSEEFSLVTKGLKQPASVKTYLSANNQTIIEIYSPVKTSGRLLLSDLNGRKLATEKLELTEGYNKVSFNFQNNSLGLNILLLQTPSYSVSAKFINR